MKGQVRLYFVDDRQVEVWRGKLAHYRVQKSAAFSARQQPPVPSF